MPQCTCMSEDTFQDLVLSIQPIDLLTVTLTLPTATGSASCPSVWAEDLCDTASLSDMASLTRALSLLLLFFIHPWYPSDMWRGSFGLVGRPREGGPANNSSPIPHWPANLRADDLQMLRRQPGVTQ